ncbi:MAG: radical SAM protein [candidate division NC10 bacterium]|nr:radical SAM protein [candidate division NC10 bacterium]MCH7895939.1 SPASM domain-containing protein [candidate division NC10 bacterium]
MNEPKRPPIVSELPRTLYLETTNRCNSKCQTCVRTFLTREPPKDLTLAELQRIVDQFPVLERVVLHGVGEPLLNRELFDMIAYLKVKGATVLFNSDAISLTPKRAQQLIDSRLDEFRVSMDGATRHTYEKIRGVDQFDRVVGNVEQLLDLQRKLEQQIPRVSLWFTAMKTNLEELPAFVRLASRIGVPEVYVQRLVYNGHGMAVADQSLHQALHAREENLIKEAEGLARTFEVAFKASGLTTPLESLHGTELGRRPWSGCQRPWTLSYVTANGNVLPCCITPWSAKNYQGALLGNAFTDDFASIWNGERYQQFRETFESDVPPDPCRGCGLLWSI